ncbi:MAG: helix-turn-helix domain-containing protein [Fusobacteriaceae bacterium]|jgi:predicted transcriptional regulator|nr:helix-turn-helix domain-containing protein [Fusobacteriaceae bacterium]
MSRLWKDIRAEAFAKNPELQDQYDSMVAREELVRRLKDFRKENALSQRDFARRIGIKTKDLLRFENCDMDPGFGFVDRIIREISADNQAPTVQETI